ncbi:MAG: methionyl-tRNA formyltransferase [Patescibacteria group bacterium]
MISDLNIIFFGTPEFAAIILDSLIKNNSKPVTVITAPDKPVGRHAYQQAGKQILTPPPVKVLSQKHNIPILQPENLKENLNLKSEILNLKPDLFIVAAYGLILPQELLAIPKYGSLNIHPSLLPKYRGPSPIQATILNGDTETGVTIILMDEKMDHGPILAKCKKQITNKITTEELTKELADLGAKLLIETLPKWINGEIKPIPQDHSKATFTKIIKKEDGQINWSNSAQEIERMVRAYWPWPSAYTRIQTTKPKIQNKILKIIKADVLKIEHQKQPGMVFLTENKKLLVACRENALILEEVQLEGKRQMTVQEFLNGYPEIVGSYLVNNKISANF